MSSFLVIVATINDIPHILPLKEISGAHKEVMWSNLRNWQGANILHAIFVHEKN